MDDLWSVLLSYSCGLFFRVFAGNNWNPRYPIGVFYSGVADQMTGAGFKLALQYPRFLIRYQIANTLTVLTVTGPFLFILS